MPIGRTCRSCGAALPPDLGWCTSCYAPVRLYSAREPVHEPGGYAGAPTPTPRTSRWRSGPTTFGPIGRIVATLALAALFPWWGLGGFSPFFLWSLMGWLVIAGVVLRSVWKPTRILDPEPTRGERRAERLRERFTGRARLAVLLIAAGGAAAAWLSLDEMARYLWTVVAILSGLGIFLANRFDL